jgi:hypothetical protein
VSAVVSLVLVLGTMAQASEQLSEGLEASEGVPMLNSAVPEAVSLAAFGLCLLGLAVAARRRKQRR